MQLNVVMTSEAMEHYLNDFLKESSLIVFYNDKSGKVQFSYELSEQLFYPRNLIFYIGSVKLFKDLILPLKRAFLDKDVVDFIYVNTEVYPDEVKMTDPIFSWYSSSKYFAILKTFIDLHLHRGLQVINSCYQGLNKTLLKWYWAEAILDIEGRVINRDGVIQIAPLDAQCD